MTLIVVGVLAAIPTGGASLLLTGLGAGGLALSGVGAGMIEYGEERGLAKSISTYKNAIQALNDDNDYYEDTGERDLPGL